MLTCIEFKKSRVVLVASLFIFKTEKVTPAVCSSYWNLHTCEHKPGGSPWACELGEGDPCAWSSQCLLRAFPKGTKCTCSLVIPDRATSIPKLFLHGYFNGLGTLSACQHTPHPQLCLPLLCLGPNSSRLIRTPVTGLGTPPHNDFIPT